MDARRTASDPGQQGFSMIELLVAMTVTLIVSSAIYGLLTAGGSAFRREPEMADRQQNIRIAMDAISRDIEAAGGGGPLVGQVFTHTDDPLRRPGGHRVGGALPQRGRSARRDGLARPGGARHAPHRHWHRPVRRHRHPRDRDGRSRMPSLPRLHRRGSHPRRHGWAARDARGDSRVRVPPRPGRSRQPGTRPHHEQRAVHGPARDAEPERHGVRWRHRQLERLDGTRRGPA